MLISGNPKTDICKPTNLAKHPQHREEQFARIRWYEGIQEEASAALETGIQVKRGIESPDRSYRTPLATRQRSWAREFTCRAGMSLEEPRATEKFARIPPVATSNGSKDMAVSEQAMSTVCRSGRFPQHPGTAGPWPRSPKSLPYSYGIHPNHPQYLAAIRERVEVRHRDKLLVPLQIGVVTLPPAQLAKWCFISADRGRRLVPIKWCVKWKAWYQFGRTSSGRTR